MENKFDIIDNAKVKINIYNIIYIIIYTQHLLTYSYKKFRVVYLVHY